MSELDEARAAALVQMAEGINLSLMTSRQAYAMGVATGYYLDMADTVPGAKTFEDDYRADVDDLALEVQDHLGWDPQS
jgi:hypothetical protein